MAVRACLGAAVATFELCRCCLEAFNWVREVFPVGPRWVMRIELWGEVASEEFDDAAILFLLKGGVEHLSVFRQIVGFVLEATSLVSVPYLGNFTGYKFLCGGSCEVAIVCGTICDGGDVSVDSFWVFVSAECAVDGFFPCERVGPDVG